MRRSFDNLVEIFLLLYLDDWMRRQCQYLCLLLISFQTRWAAFNQVPVSTWRWYNRKNIFSSSKNICRSGGLGAEPDVRGDGARDGGGAHPLVPRRGAAQHRRQGRSQHPQWQGQLQQGDGSSITSMLRWKHNIFRRKAQIRVCRELYINYVTIFCSSFYSGYWNSCLMLYWCDPPSDWWKKAWNAV